MRSRLLRRVLVGVLLVVAMVAGTTAWQAVQATAEREQRCAANLSDSTERAGLDSGEGRRIAVIGDSYSVGLGLEDLSQSWPSRLPGRVHVEGFSGSGFSRGASACRQVWYAARAPQTFAGDPELVVVEGGLNDWDQSDEEVAAGAGDLLSVLGDREVVLVGPARAPARADQVDRIDAVLARVAADHDVQYVSAKDWSLEYLEDGLHLTDEGHEAFGDLVAASLPD